jgi:hypothetical protein
MERENHQMPFKWCLNHQEHCVFMLLGDQEEEVEYICRKCLTALKHKGTKTVDLEKLYNVDDYCQEQLLNWQTVFKRAHFILSEIEHQTEQNGKLWYNIFIQKTVTVLQGKSLE